MSPKILLHGSGAIGTTYLYLLHQAGVDITAVCRSNYDVVENNGFLVDSEKYGKGIRFHPKIAHTPAEAASNGPFDYIIVTTKTLPTAETSKVIAPAVTEGKTCIVLIQNGVGIEEEFAEAFPKNPLLSCVVYIASTQIAPGHLQMGKFEALEFGTFPASAYNDNAGVKDAADVWLELLKEAGSNAQRYDDVQEKRWNKLLLNAAWNPISALTLSRDVAFRNSSPGANQVTESVMLEVASIARALGYTALTPEVVHQQLKKANESTGEKGVEPSMLVDALHSRRMEVEALIGSPVRMAKDAKVDVPRLELLYVLAKALDESMAHRRPGESLAGDWEKSSS